MAKRRAERASRGQSAKLPPRAMRRSAVAGPRGAFSGFESNGLSQSAHPPQTLPCMSDRPQAVGLDSPPGRRERKAVVAGGRPPAGKLLRRRGVADVAGPAQPRRVVAAVEARRGAGAAGVLPLGLRRQAVGLALLPRQPLAER